jgi:uncharacterized membrane protein
MLLVGAKLHTPRRKQLLNFAFMYLLAGSIVLQAACSGGKIGGGGSARTAGTPAGSYTITVVGAAGSIQHTTTLTLTVQ